MHKIKPISQNNQAPAPVVPGTNKVTAEKAQQILAENGLVVTNKQAKVVAEFLYKMAEWSKR